MQAFVVSFDSLVRFYDPYLAMIRKREIRLGGFAIMTEKIIEKELSYRINGCIFAVHNEVGPGLREECYQKAMEICLHQAGIPYARKPRTRGELVHRGIVVDVFEPDLLVPERVVIELKHLPEGFSRDHFTQALNYVKFFDVKLGLLVNFAMDKAIIERLPRESRIAIVTEDYAAIRDVVEEHHRPLLREIRESLLEINGRIGIGYAAATYHNLAIVEFRARGLKCDAEIEVSPSFREKPLPRSPITPLLVDDRVCVQIEAIQDQVSARTIRAMQTHLELTGCGVGIVACFGKTNFLIQGVRRKTR